MESVFAGLQSQRSEGDNATLNLRLASGILVQSFFSMSSVEEQRFEVYCQNGKLMIDRFLSLDAEVTEPAMKFARLKRLQRGLMSLHPHLLMRSPGYEPSFEAALKTFVTSVRSGQPVKPDLFDGYQNLAVIEAAEESVMTGRLVSIADVAALDAANTKFDSGESG